MPYCPHWWAQVRKASTQTFTVLSTLITVEVETEILAWENLEMLGEIKPESLL